MRRALGVAGLVLGVLAASAQTGTGPSARDRERVFQLTLPPGWVHVRKGNPDFERRLKALGDRGDAIRRSTEPHLSNPQFVLIGMDLTTAAVNSGFAPNLNVIKSEAQMARPTQERMLALGRRIAEELGSDMHVKSVRLPIGHAASFTGRYSVGQTRTEVVGYVFVIRSQVYVATISFAAGKGRPGLARRIVDSIRRVPRR